jgi:hypothetical protein
MAHAIWSVSDGSILTPFAATSKDGKDRQLTRFVDENDYAKAVEATRKHMTDAISDHLFAAAYFDGYYTYENGERLDAIYLIGQWNDGGEIRELMMSIPYQPKKEALPFKVFKPKLRSFDNIDSIAVQQAFNAFWDGVDHHTEAAAVWNAALDQSK